MNYENGGVALLDRELAGKHALITGSVSGIGLGIAHRLARDPADEYPEWIEVETTYKTMMYEYLSRLQDVMAYEENSKSSAASKLLASRP